MSDDTMENAEPNRHDPQSKSSFSLNARDAGPGGGMVTVPMKPTANMLAEGARAAGVSVETAWKIYRAMVLYRD